MHRAGPSIALFLAFTLFACSKSDSPEGAAGTTVSGSGGTSGSDAGGNDASTGGSAGSAGTSNVGGTGGRGGMGGAGDTGGSAGSADDAGSSGAGGASSADGSVEEGAACGSRGLDECPDGTFCERPASAQCGIADAPGTCIAPPTECPDVDSPVCGCDDTTYSNACLAASEGMSVKHFGACGAQAAPDCILDGVLCRAAPPECPDFHVPTQEGNCYGPCVPIEACACEGPSDCPDLDQYNCHLSAGHCGPYVN